VIVEVGMNRGELLYGLHPPDALHDPLSPAQQKVCVFGLIVGPALDQAAILDAFGIASI